MSARSIDMENRALLLLHKGVGVRTSTVYRLSYDLVVIANDVQDVTTAAGGWLCDRARAGWQVSVLLPQEFNVRALNILGVGTCIAEDPYQVMRGFSPAAVAVAASVLSEDPRVERFFERAAERRSIELTIWGEDVPGNIMHHFDAVQHPASDAARAFKAHAVAAAGGPKPPATFVERFHSTALWYPADGTDLVPVK